MGYCQSDEISLLLIDYQRLETSAWFDYEVQKMCSVAASMTTMAFNRLFKEIVSKCNTDTTAYTDKFDHAMFDARVFNIPKEEVTNYFYWRQLDCSRNSIQMTGQANFSHRELQNKSCNDIQDMLMFGKGINWSAFPTYQKRGSCVIRNQTAGESDEVTDKYILHERSNWVIDKDIPIFKGDGRQYIEQLIYVGCDE